MATYYARAVNGNWSANTSWDSASSAGAGPAGPPIAGDTAVFDAGSTGVITLSASAACLNLNMDNHGGTLALSSSGLTIGTNGSIVLGGTITATTGYIGIGGNVSITCNAITIPQLRHSASGTYTLNDDLLATTLWIQGTSSPVFAGAFDIICTNFYYASSVSATSSLTLVAGQTLSVSTLMSLIGASNIVATIKSGTGSSDTFIDYNGTDANRLVANITFTDVNAAHPIDNWYGGTLTRCTNIQNVTSATQPTRLGIFGNGAITNEAGANARGGSGNCIKFNPGSTTINLSYGFLVPVTAATDFALSFWHKITTDYNGTVKVTVYDSDDDNTKLLTAETASLTNDGAYHQYTSTTCTPTSTGFCRVVIDVLDGATTGDVYIDDLTVAEV